MSDLDSSYIDFPTLLAPSFSSTGYAAGAVERVTDPLESPPIDLSPALARVLFDIQELDSRIDTLARRTGVAALRSAARADAAAAAAVGSLAADADRLAAAYAALEHAVLAPAGRADAAVAVARRVCDALDLLQLVARALALARTLQASLGRARQLASALDYHVRDQSQQSAATAAAAATATTAAPISAAAGSLAAVLDEATDTVDKLRHVLATRAGQVVAVKSAQRIVVQPAVRSLVSLLTDRIQADFKWIGRTALLAEADPPSWPPPILAALIRLTADTPGRFTALVRDVIDGYVADVSASFSAGLLRHQGVLTQLLSGSSVEVTRRNVGMVMPARLLSLLGQRCRAVVALEKALQSALASPSGPGPSSSPSSPASFADLLAALDATTLPSFFFVRLSQKLSAALAHPAAPAAGKSASSPFQAATGVPFGQYSSVLNNLLPLSGLGLAGLRSPSLGAAAAGLPPVSRSEIARAIGATVEESLPPGNAGQIQAATAVLTQAVAVGLVALLGET